MTRVSFFLALLLALICLSVPAQASTPAAGSGPGSSAIGIIEEGEEEPEEEGEGDPETGDPPPGNGGGGGGGPPVEEEADELEEETSPFPPDECLLRTARARVFAYTSQERVRLVVRYTSLAPANVKVTYRVKGGLTVGTAKQRFAEKGLFRLSKHLSEAQAAKVEAAKGFTVQMSIPAAPRYCNEYYSRHLTIRRTVHNQVVWFQSDSIFGTTR